jgi:hypothetical protein
MYRVAVKSFRKTYGYDPVEITYRPYSVYDELEGIAIECLGKKRKPRNNLSRAIG